MALSPLSSLIAFLALIADRFRAIVLLDSPRPSCLGHSVMGVVWGIWALRGATDSSALPDRISTEAVGGALLVFGLVRILCMLTGARGTLAMFHRVAAFASGLVWLFLGISSLILTSAASTAGPTYILIALVGFWTWWRYWIQARSMLHPNEAGYVMDLSGRRVA